MATTRSELERALNAAGKKGSGQKKNDTAGANKKVSGVTRSELLAALGEKNSGGKAASAASAFSAAQPQAPSVPVPAAVPTEQKKAANPSGYVPMGDFNRKVDVGTETYFGIKKALESGDTATAYYLQEKNWDDLSDYWKSGINNLWGSTEERVAAGGTAAMPVEKYQTTARWEQAANPRDAKVITDELEGVKADWLKANEWYNVQDGHGAVSADFGTFAPYLKQKYGVDPSDVTREEYKTLLDGIMKPLEAEQAEAAARYQRGQDYESRILGAEGREMMMGAEQKIADANWYLGQYVDARVALERELEQDVDGKRAELTAAEKKVLGMKNAYELYPSDEAFAAWEQAAAEYEQKRNAYNDYVQSRYAELDPLWDSAMSAGRSATGLRNDYEALRAEKARELPVLLAQKQREAETASKEMGYYGGTAPAPENYVFQYGSYKEAAEAAEVLHGEVEKLKSAAKKELETQNNRAQQAYYDQLMEREDFAENSKYAPLDESEWKAEATPNPAGGKFYNGEEYKKKGALLYEAVNGNKEASRILDDLNADGNINYGAFLGENASNHMTDDEVAVFNWLYIVRGSEAATTYYNELAGSLNARQRVDREKSWSKYADEHPWKASAATVLAAPMKGLAFVAQVGDALTDDGLDPNAGYNRWVYVPNAMRNQVAKRIEENWGEAGTFFYQTGMSMADFLFTTAISGGNSKIALAIMGTSTAADTTLMAKEKGLSDGQAIVLGGIAAAIEIFTEKVSLDAMLGKTAWSKTAIGHLLANTIAEGSEEGTSELLNTLADILISQDKSDWKRAVDNYVALGYSENEAFRMAFTDKAGEVGLAALGGAFSGEVIGSVGSVGIAISNRNEATVRAAVQEAMADENSIAYGVASKLQEMLDAGQLPSKENLKALEAAVVMDNLNRKIAEKNETAAPEGTTVENEGKLELPKVEETSDVYSLADQKQPTYEELAAKKSMTVTDIGVNAEGKSFADLQADALQTAEEKGWLDNPLHNEDTDSLWFVSKDTLSHARNSVQNEGVNEEGTLLALAHLDKIVQDARLTAVNDPKNPAKAESRVHTFFAAVQQNGKVLPVKLQVKEYAPDATYQLPKNVQRYVDAHGDITEYGKLYDVVALEVLGEGKETPGATGEVPGLAAGLLTTPGVSEISVAELLALVNGDARKYIPVENDGKLELPKVESTETEGGIKDRRGATVWDKEGGIVENEHSAKLDPVTREFYQTVAKQLGTKILFTDTITAEVKGKKRGANGYMRPDGVMVIALDAVAKSGANPLIVVGKHEITHRLKQLAPKEYAKYRDSAAALMAKGKHISVEALVQQYMEDQGLSRDGAMDEIAADFTEQLLTNQKQLNAFLGIEDNRNGFRKLIDALKEFLEKIGSAFNGSAVDAETKVLWKKHSAELKQAVELWENAYAAAAQNVQDTISRENRAAEGIEEDVDGEAQKNTTEGGVVQYSIRKDIVDVNGKEYDSVVELDKTVSARILSNPKRFMNHIKDKLVGLKIPVTDASGNVEIIEFAGANETTSKNKNPHPVLGELAYTKGDTRKQVIVNAKEVIEESLYDPQYSNTNNDHGWLDKNGWESRKTYVLAQDGMIYEAYLKIAKTRDGRNLFYAVNLDINNGIAVDKGATTKRAAVLAAVPSHNRIAERVPAVKGQMSVKADDSVKHEASQAQMEALRQEIDRLNDPEYQKTLLVTYGLDALKASEKEVKRLQKRLERLEQRGNGEGKQDAAKVKKEQAKPAGNAKPNWSQSDLRKTLMRTFSVPKERREAVGAHIDYFAEKLLEKGRLTDAERKQLLDILYESGTMTELAEERFAEGRTALLKKTFYVPESVREAFGEDWGSVQKRALDAGVLLTSDENAPSVFEVNRELADGLPSVFDGGQTDGKVILETLLQVAEEGQDLRMDLAEYIAQLEGREDISAEKVLAELEEGVEQALKDFAAKAGLEVRLRNRSEAEIFKERAQQREKAEKARKERNLRELQKKTLKLLQWLKKNIHKLNPEDLAAGILPPEVGAVWEEVLSDLDLYAVSAADEMHWSEKYQATYRDIADMADRFEGQDNFVKTKDLERIVSRVKLEKLSSYDPDTLQDLFNAAVAIRKAFQDRNKLLGETEHEMMSSAFSEIRKDMAAVNWKIPKGKLAKNTAAFFSDRTLSPINKLRQMVGWKNDSAFVNMANQLVNGEIARNNYKARAQLMLADFMKKHKKWMRRADGQGKDGIWYEVQVPELISMTWGNPENGQKNTAGGGEITVDSTEQQRYALLKGEKLAAAKVNAEKLQGEDLTQYETRKKSAVEKPILKLAQKLGIPEVNLRNSKLNFPFQYSATNIKKSLHHQLEYGGGYSSYAKALTCMDELVQKAVLVETHPDYKAGTEKENADLKQVYVLMSLMRDGDRVTPIVFEVKEFYNYANGLYLTVALKEIDSAVVDTELTGKPGSMPHLFAESTISIEDVFKNVNPADGEFLKYVPDEFLDEAQKKAKEAAVERRVAKYGEQARPKRSLGDVSSKSNSGLQTIFGETHTVYMTPMQKVQLYLESKGKDNLRHMMGGRTFVDKDFYGKGDRAEGFAQGKTIRLAPETVKALVKDMTPVELELAKLLEQYYNELSKEEINRVSNILYGYNKAMGTYYAPIYTDSSYHKSEPGVYDFTPESVGNLHTREVSKTPTLNISAIDAFEKSVDMTADFVGMAIPMRNWNVMKNWQSRDINFEKMVEKTWGTEGVEYIDDLLNDLMGIGQRQKKGRGDKLFSSYVSAKFGFNPGIVLKQLGSVPLAAAYLGVKNRPSGRQIRQIDRKFVAKYTELLEHRMMGYATPETRRLKDNPNWTQRNKFFRDVFGGGIITAMDGKAASILWPWAENKVAKEYPHLPKGTQEEIESGESPFYKKVAEVFHEAVLESQSVSDVMHQSEMRRSDRMFDRIRTVFRSDSAQAYNTLRRMIGEAQYLEKSGASKEQLKKAYGRVNTTVGAILLSVLLAELVDLAVAAVKRKGKRYRDDEDELTAESIAEEVLQEMLENLAGLIPMGDIAVDAVGAVFSDERWYGLDTPGVDQAEIIMEGSLNAAQKLANFVRDAETVRKQGGDVGMYLRQNGPELRGILKDAGTTLAENFFGVPVANVEAYLLGITKTLVPEAATEYEDFFGAAEKGSLKGLEGDALETRLGNIFELRTGGDGISEDAVAAVAELYAAGYTDVVPSATQDDATVDGEEIEFTAAQQQTMDKAWADVVPERLDALVKSEAFLAATEEDRVKAIKKLYDYGREKGKAAVIEDYELPSGAAELEADDDPAVWLTATAIVGNDGAEGWLEIAELPLQDSMKREMLQDVMSEKQIEGLEIATSAGFTIYDYCKFQYDLKVYTKEREEKGEKTLKEDELAFIDKMNLTTQKKDALYFALGYSERDLKKAPWN